MLSRILLGCACFIAFLTLVPQSVEAKNPVGDRFQRSRGLSLSQGGCRTFPRRVHVTLPRSQTRYFCIDGVRKRRLPCGVVERWKPAFFKHVNKKVRVSGGCRTEVRYRIRYLCGVQVRIPYTVQIALPDRWEFRKQRVHVPGCWIPEKGRKCRIKKCCNTRRDRF